MLVVVVVHFVALICAPLLLHGMGSRHWIKVLRGHLLLLATLQSLGAVQAGTGRSGVGRRDNGVGLVDRANEAGAETVHGAGGGQGAHRPHNVVAEVVHHEVAGAVLAEATVVVVVVVI